MFFCCTVFTTIGESEGGCPSHTMNVFIDLLFLLIVIIVALLWSLLLVVWFLLCAQLLMVRVSENVCNVAYH